MVSAPETADTRRPRATPAEAMGRRTDPDDVHDLVRACAAGDAAARRAFQERYGQDIYNFPVKIYGVPAERAVDFYVYVFERDRIFTRMRTFEGRNGIQFRTFLAYYVLRSLFLEWQRGNRELDTVSLSDHHLGDARGRHADRASSAEAAGEPRAAPARAAIAEVWATLGPEEQLDLKLLSLLEYQLTPEDVRLLARVSRRSLADTTALLAEVEAGLRQRDVKLARLRDELDSVWGWIVLRRRELQETNERLRLMGQTMIQPRHGDSSNAGGELEHALAKRMRQRERLLDEIRELQDDHALQGHCASPELAGRDGVLPHLPAAPASGATVDSRRRPSRELPRSRCSCRSCSTGSFPRRGGVDPAPRGHVRDVPDLARAPRAGDGRRPRGAWRPARAPGRGARSRIASRPTAWRDGSRAPCRPTTCDRWRRTSRLCRLSRRRRSGQPA